MPTIPPGTISVDLDEAAVDEPTTSARILIVDDERVIRDILCEFLALEGFVVRGVEDGERALAELRTRPYDLVITDLKMPKLSGIELLDRIAAEHLEVLTVIMTGFGTVETAIEAALTAGLRTADLAAGGAAVSTKEMTERIVAAL